MICWKAGGTRLEAPSDLAVELLCEVVEGLEVVLVATDPLEPLEVVESVAEVAELVGMVRLNLSPTACLQIVCIRRKKRNSVKLSNSKIWPLYSQQRC